MNIQLTINGQVLSATLEDSAAARDFVALLPLTLDLEDYASTEKIAQLPRKLSTAGAPAGITPSIGDVTYYAPWGNLAIFYKGSGHANGLVKLGHIKGDIQVLRGRGPLKAHIGIAATH
ncbi:MAG: cyclophilin-like fold protein [Caldimonas manganoxidans]|nr:cyclophilin-like fold protein [Caldimonas manganoxidans]